MIQPMENCSLFESLCALKTPPGGFCRVVFCFVSANLCKTKSFPNYLKCFDSLLLESDKCSEFSNYEVPNHFSDIQ